MLPETCRRSTTHSSRFLPSKRTIASEGAAVVVAPGVTIFGSGFQTSVSSGLGLAVCGACAASATVKSANESAKESDAAVDRLVMTHDFASSRHPMSKIVIVNGG